MSDVVKEQDIEFRDDVDQDEAIIDANIDDDIDSDESQAQGDRKDQIMKTLKFAGVKVIEDDK